MPQVTPPEELPDAFASVWREAPEKHDGGEFTKALSVRVAPSPGPVPEGSTQQCLWVKSAHPLPDEPMLHACGLAYASDLLLAPSAALHLELPWVLRPKASTVFLTSLDHAIWFHRPFRADEWLLVVQRSPTAGTVVVLRTATSGAGTAVWSPPSSRRRCCAQPARRLPDRSRAATPRPSCRAASPSRLKRSWAAKLHRTVRPWAGAVRVWRRTAATARPRPSRR